MLVIAAAVIGAALGALTAKRRKGNAADMAQYAFGFAVAFGLVTLFAAMILERVLA